MAVDDSSDATNGGSVEIDVTANDIAADEEDTLTIDSVAQGTNGTVSVTTGGVTDTHDGSATLPIPLPRRSPYRVDLSILGIFDPRIQKSVSYLTAIISDLD